MILSEERQSHLAHVIVDGLWKDDLVDYTNDDEAIRTAKRAMTQFVADMEKVDQAVRTKISSLKRGVLEGTREWDILYSKYYEEEMQRRGNI